MKNKPFYITNNFFSSNITPCPDLSQCGLYALLVTHENQLHRFRYAFYFVTACFPTIATPIHQVPSPLPIKMGTIAALTAIENGKKGTINMNPYKTNDIIIRSASFGMIAFIFVNNTVVATPIIPTYFVLSSSTI